MDSCRNKGFKDQLLEADAKNTWDNVFDKTTVCGKSFRMPFCDKIVFGRQKERRPVKPARIMRFSFDDADGIREAWAAANQRTFLTGLTGGPGGPLTTGSRGKRGDHHL